LNDNIAAEVKALYKHADSLRTPHLDELRDCARYTSPSRDFETHDGQSPDRTFLYDSTAVDSAQNLVTTTMHLLLPQNQQWAQIVLADELLKRVIGPNVVETLSP
jgi:head-to-tail connecting protein